MGYDTPDFFRDPKVEKAMPPHGYDFWRPPAEDGAPVTAQAAPGEPLDPEKTPEVKEPEKMPESPVAGSGVEKFKCKLCGYVCATEKGMKMHITKEHGK